MIQRISQSSFSCGPVAQTERGHHRHERERQDQRAGQGEDHGQRHGPEQLSFGSLEGQDRQVDDGDDQLAEHRRLAHLDGGVADDLELGPRSPSWASRRTQFSTMITLESTIRPKSIAPRLIRLADTPVASMMLAAKSIDSGMASATISPPRRLPSIASSTTITRTPAGHQVVQHRAQGLVDQVSAVIERLDRDARGQAFLKLGDLGLDIVDHLPAVLADQHHHQAGDDLSFTVAGGQPRPDHRRGVDLGNLADGHGHAVALVDDDGRDVLHRPRLAHAPDVAGLPLVDQVAAPHVRVVVLESVEDVGHRQAERSQRVGIHFHLVGLELTPMGIDLGHPRHLAQLVGDEPVEEGTQFHRRDLRLRRGLDLELEDLAQRRGDRPQHGRAVTRGYRLGRPGQSLADKLPRPVDVGPFLEHDRHHRDPELGDRPDLLDIGQPAHRSLDREREQRLDLQRRKRRRLRDHLDLHVGQVGHGVDRQVDQPNRLPGRRREASPSAPESDC